MSVQAVMESAIDGIITLRNEPVQARSTARLAALLDGAASIIDQIGYERLTTAMVAERAGASIGTVYRYFPDRIALLQALGARNLERLLGSVSEEVSKPEHKDSVSAVNGAFSAIVDIYRSEPGFRSLRVGDVIDLRPAPTERPFNSIVSDRIADSIIARFDIADSSELRFDFETAVEIADGLTARAFARAPRGDEAFLSAARSVIMALLSKRLS
ncbi:MAG: TetR family transcriptional regulator [Salinibacterium sp.]|nr:TetR family transcriptional regulator [Salinibacterium sp.]